MEIGDGLTEISVDGVLVMVLLGFDRERKKKKEEKEETTEI